MSPHPHMVIFTRRSAAGIVVATVVGAAAMATMAAAQEGARDECIFGAGEAITVAGVVDGDTLKLADGSTVRLAGVVTPRGRIGGGESSPSREAARRALSELLASGAVTMITAGDGADRYGRIHGQVFVEQADRASTWVQEALIQRGLARVERPDLSSPCNGRLRDAEATAITAQSGLWGEAAYRIREASDPSLAQQIGLYEVVEGLVLSVGTRTYMTFVDFGRDYRRDFTVMMTPSMVEKLADAGISVTDLTGRRVRVRGVIELGGGPAIRLKRVDEIAIVGDE